MNTLLDAVTYALVAIIVIPLIVYTSVLFGTLAHLRAIERIFHPKSKKRDADGKEREA